MVTPFAAFGSTVARARRHAWLAWLLLALPLGQLAAQWHLLSHHASVAVAGERDDAGLSAPACDLCLGAAAVAAGALAAAAPAWGALAAPAVHGRVADTGVGARHRAPVYRSRAPPR
ncbi:MAG: hypothetical protein U1E89_05985 [Burkholderiaceae bacterium]